MAKPFWKEGIQFSCQGTGQCCVSRNGYGYVYLSLQDRRRLAQHLGIPTRDFTRKHCAKTGGWFHLKDSKAACPYLNGTRCGVYEARPTQCRTWPFWPENMKAKVWASEIAAFCPGVGKGRRYSAEEIRKQLKKDSWRN